MDYTTKQMEYINSVGGKAHASAVRIIGEWEAELESAKASKLVFVPAMSEDMKETYLEDNIALQARIRELEGALKPFVEAHITNDEPYLQDLQDIAKQALKDTP